MRVYKCRCVYRCIRVPKYICVYRCRCVYIDVDVCIYIYMTFLSVRSQLDFLYNIILELTFENKCICIYVYICGL